MSSSITLSAATRQNLLSLQGTAELLSTTQNRLATSKKVNSALDNPTNFFTADALTSRSSALSGLLDGISNGIQTIQAANTGLTKLQGLTDQLKSVAQQALATSNAFSAKASSTSANLTGATAQNLLSTGPTQGVSDTAIGSSNTALAAATTALSNFATGTAATVTGSAFTLPANAIASSATGSAAFAAGTNAATLTFTGGGLAGTTSITIGTAASISAVNTAIANDAALSAAGFAAVDDGGKLKITNASGATFTVQGNEAATLGGTSAITGNGGTLAASSTLTINGTAITIKGGKAGDTPTTVQNAALTAINGQTATTGVTAAINGGAFSLTGKSTGESFTVQSSDPSLGFSTPSTTIYNKSAADQTLTVNGIAIQIGRGSTQAQAITQINSYSSVTGVTASNDTTTPTKIKLSGSSDGASFTVTGSTGNTLGFNTTATTYSGTFHPTATTLASAIGFREGDSFTVNGQSVSVSSKDTLNSLAQKVTTATNGTVSAAFDESTRTFKFTAADTTTAVTLGNGSTATSLISNLGFTGGNTKFAAGIGAPGSASPLSGTSLTVKVANGSATTLTFGSAAGQISTLSDLNKALATSNAQASIDAATGRLTITTANEYGADDLTVTGSASANGGASPFTSATSSAIVGGDGANSRSGLVTTYNNLLTQITQLAADSGYNGVNLLNGDNLKISFNEKSTSSISVEGSTVNATNLGLSALGNTDFQENSSINKIVSAINSASAQLKAQASSLGSNLSVVQNRQDFTKQIVNVLDTGAANLTNADLNEEAANSQALSTRNSLGISALSLANQAQQGVLQLLR